MANDMNERVQLADSIDAGKRSSRSAEELANSLDRWFEERQGDSRRITSVSVPDSNGMSSETVMIDTNDGAVDASLVVRIQPSADDVPIFASYDLELQHRIMALVAERSDVPVPEVGPLEPDPAWIGSAFFMMDKVDGRVPPDVPPYTFEGWMTELDEEALTRLESSTVSILARLHAIEVDEEVADILGRGSDAWRSSDGVDLLSEHVDRWRAYHRWTCGDEGVGLINAGFDWLDANRPERPGPAVISWGDSRIGNIIFGEDATPVAVLDWEMAELAPAAMDLGWLSFFHDFFQDVADVFELPGVPGLFGPDRIGDLYRDAGGIEMEDLHWYRTYAAVRHAIIMCRVGQRAVHFGEVDEPDNQEAHIIHAGRLGDMIAG